jgi:hypothetical protein
VKLKFWEREIPAPSGECRHLWSNWSDPSAVNVTSYSMFASGSTEREGWAQDRHCLTCNVYERRLA